MAILLGEKNTSHDWKTTRITTFLVLRAFASVCGRLQGVCGDFAGRSCRKKRLSVASVVFANHCAFKIHLGCHKAPLCSAEQILICPMHVYFPSANGSN